jgi:hypothetical protein
MNLLPSLLAITLLFLLPARLMAFVEIDVQQPVGSALIDNGTVNYGNISVGNSSTKTFRIRNLGDQVLTLTSFQLTGVHKNDFSMSGTSAGVLNPGNTRDFSVTFSPEGFNLRSAKLQIYNNDPNENPYDINLSGIGIGVDITVRQGAQNLSDGVSIVKFGNMTLGGTARRNFTVGNAGIDPLSGISVVVSGGSAWSRSSVTTTTLNGGGSFSFEVRFQPQAAGTDAATLTIFSNDPDEGAFSISLTGNGVLPGEGDADDLDGDGTPNLIEDATGTDRGVPSAPPGTFVINGANIEFTYTRSVATLSELLLTVETSDDLSGIWGPPAGFQELTLSDDGTLQTIVASWPVPASGRHFTRLRALR